MPPILNVDNLTKSYGVRPLFRGITFGIGEGERLGLIGPNGAGKSTLLQILAGEEMPDDGEMTVRRGLRIRYVPQVDRFPEGATVESVLLDALADEQLDPHERQVRADVIRGRFDFPDPTQPAAALSGGWAKRLALARAMVAEPELLLLDEPTNHLDLEGILWLEGLLLDAPWACVLVSHDRYLLERTVGRVVEISRAYPAGFFSADGRYSDFLIKREEFLQGQASRQQALQSIVRREVAWLQRGARARTTKAKGRIEDAGELMTELAETQERNAQSGRAVQVSFTASGRQTKKLLVARGLEKTLGGRTLFRGLDIELRAGTRLGLLGANGSGKTTLLRMLAGELPPDHGTVWQAENLRIVYFEQHRQALDPRLSLRDALSPTGDFVDYRGQAIHVTAWAKRFLFTLEQLPLPVAELSGGEQARILIAHLMRQPADVLILDEPTNDLDIPSLEVLEESLADFPGTLLLVTHDRYLLDRVCTGLLALDGAGKAEPYTEYAQWERAQLQRAQAPKATAKPVAKPAPVPSKSAKKLTWREERELESMEATILAAEAEVEAAVQAMQNPTVLADHQALHEWSNKHHAAEERVKVLYARWQELEEKAGG
ncbi:MAG: ABC-F family ATP-binding cassette domain-containing protein [Armatimonadota bacterium]